MVHCPFGIDTQQIQLLAKEMVIVAGMDPMPLTMKAKASPLYISEVAPAKKRGGLVTFYQLAITIGILVAYISNYFLQQYATNHAGEEGGLLTWLFIEQVWRGMFLVGVIPAALFCLLLMIVPESPRWLAIFGRNEEALAS